MSDDLFKSGFFTMHSGGKTNFKIDCDALSDKSIESIAQTFLPSLKHFSEVVGVPRGGIRLAEAMEAYKSPYGGLLVCDDVYTTGTSMKKYYKLIDNCPCQGIVIFARKEIDYGTPWIKSMFQLTLNNL